MIGYIIVSLIIFIYIYITYSKYNKDVILFIPQILILLELGRLLSFNFGFETGYNGFNLFIIVLVLYLSNNINLNITNDNKIFSFLLLLFLIVMIFRSDWRFDNYLNMLSRIGNTFIVFYFYLVGYRIKNITYKVYLYFYNIVKSILWLIVFTTISSILRVGETAYPGGVIYGPTQFQLYYFAFAAIILLMVIYNNTLAPHKYRYDRFFLIFMALSVLLIVAMSLMRTTWVITFGGLICYLLFAKLTKNKFKFSLIIVFFSIISIFIVNQFDLLSIRSSRFDEGYNIEEEGRILEFILTQEKINNSIETLLLGTGKLFESVGELNFRRASRPIHSAYTNIIFGAGYLGLAIYVMLLAIIAKKILSLLRLRAINYHASLIIATVSGLFLGILLAFFSANTTYGYGISYFICSFMVIGLLINYCQKLYIDKKL